MDKYQKVRVLGKGSFGSAILIKRKVDNALFVVKEVSLLKMSKKERDEARHECTILQKLKHPNIVRYVEQFENQKSLYIVMEYCDGGDLSGKIQQTRGPMKESTIMYYFSQVCLAMEYLHAFHMLHRDIKTMNVFLMKSGAVKLGDFGITTILRNTMGMANTVCGTPYYFSPELCRNKPYNNKSDIWALGILLYECATGGRHPFDGANMNQLMQRIVTGQCAALSSQYSSEFRKMVAWCLQKDPARRPSIKQLLSLPLIRRSLEQLEENLMLATECRVRLKDIIDFDVASPNSEAPSAQKAPAPQLEPKKAKQPAGLTPGQAAAMAVVQQSPRRGSPVAKPIANILGPKPKVGNVLNHLNNANNGTPRELYQRNILDNLHQMQNKLNGAAPVPVSPRAKTPPSPSNRKEPPTNSEPSDRSDVMAGVRDLSPYNEYQPNVQRIKAIMAKYEHNANPQAKETIHAYMRRKQEEYLKKQREDMERRKRLNELRQKELQHVLVQQRRVALGVGNNVFANGNNANGKPIKEAQAPAPALREVGLSPRDNRALAAPPSPSNNERRFSPIHSPAHDGILPSRIPAQGLQRGFGVDPRYAPSSPTKGAAKGNTPFLMAPQHKPKLAANSPLHADKVVRERAKPAVAKHREEKPSLAEHQKVYAKNHISNGYALERLDHKAREVVSRGVDKKKHSKQRPSFVLNAEALKKQRNSVEKVATPKGEANDGMVITGTPVPKLRSHQSRQMRPLRPALLDALLDDGKAAACAAPKVTPPPTPVNNHNAEKRVRSSFNVDLQPHAGTPAARPRGRVPSSPSLTPRGLAALPPAALHVANAPAEGGADRLFKRAISAPQCPDLCNLQEKQPPLSPPKRSPFVATKQPFSPPVGNSNAALARPAENGDAKSQAHKASEVPLTPTNIPLMEVALLDIKSTEDNISEAELIDVAHSVTGCAPTQGVPLANKKMMNLSRSDSKTSDATAQSKKAGFGDLKPVFHPTVDARPHHLCWPLSGEAARYAGMLKGPNIPAVEVERHPLGDVGGEAKEQEVVMPSMLETLRTLRSEVSPHGERGVANHFSKQLALLKQRQRLGMERHQFYSKDTPTADANSQSNERALEPISEKPSSSHATPRGNLNLDVADAPSSRCASAKKHTPVSQHLDRELESETRRTSLVEGYEDMLRHLRSLLEKRKVSYRNIRKLYNNADDGVGRPSKPTTLSGECPEKAGSSKEATSAPSDTVLGSPPLLFKTKPGREAKNLMLAGVDELSEVLNTDEEPEDANGNDDNFEDAVPLSPVRCVTRNDMYTQMLQKNAIKGSEIGAKYSNVSDILHSNHASHGQDEVLKRGCARC